MTAPPRTARPRASPNPTSVGRKMAMALSGAVLVLFVIGHFIGNLKVYSGPEDFNHYAEGLRTIGAPFFGHGQLLWLIRLVLLAAVFVHIGAAAQLVLQSRRARPIRYARYEPLAFSYASRTMVWGGLTILAFVVYHLLHLTLGTVHPDFIAGDAYHNFVSGFRAWPVSLAYVIAMVPLGFHLYHGVWSAFQTLGATGDDRGSWRRPAAMVIAAGVCAGNATFPLAVLTGVLR